MTIYHNPRCSKSRQTLEIIKKSQQEFEIVEYLKDLLSISELEIIIEKLGITPVELVRKNELIWKENYKGKNLSDKEIVQAMIENPKIMERPIVVNGEKAVLGRPPENVLKIINQSGIWSFSNFPSLNQTKTKQGITDAKKIIHQNAIKKTNTNIRKPRNFIIINFVMQINNNN